MWVILLLLLQIWMPNWAEADDDKSFARAYDVEIDAFTGTAREDTLKVDDASFIVVRFESFKLRAGG